MLTVDGPRMYCTCCYPVTTAASRMRKPSCGSEDCQPLTAFRKNSRLFQYRKQDCNVRMDRPSVPLRLKCSRPTTTSPNTLAISADAPRLTEMLDILCGGLGFS
jgi:hypothetical protein